MKRLTILLIFAALTVGGAVPGIAGYRRLQEEKNQYQAPEFLTRYSELVPEEGTRAPGREGSQAVSKALEQIREDRAGMEGKPDALSSFFGPAYQLAFRQMSGISGDEAAVAGKLGQGLRLTEVVALALLRDPSVRSARQAVRAALSAFDQVAGLEETLTAYQRLAGDNVPGVGPMAGTPAAAWPFPGKTALKGRIVAADVAMAETRKAVAEKNTALKATRAFWDLALVAESLDVSRETVEALKRLKGVATSLYNSGKAGFQDIARVNIRLALQEENLITLARKRETLALGLAKVLNLPLGTRLGPMAAGQHPGPVPDENPLYPSALENRQELVLIRQKMEKMAHMVTLGETMANANFTLGLSTFEFNPARTGAGGGPAFPEKTMAGMKNGQPIKAFNGTAQPWLAQTRESLESLKSELAAMENDTVRRVREAWFALDQNRREAILYEKQILPLSRSGLDVAISQYETGAIGFADAIAAYTDWLEARLALVRKRTGLGISRAMLEQLKGNTFE